jgi:hypothetical protein
MNVIKSFELDKEQIKAALTQWLNTCVLKEPCEIEEFELNPYKVGREVSITLKEKAAISLSLPSDVKEVSDDSSI